MDESRWVVSVKKSQDDYMNSKHLTGENIKQYIFALVDSLTVELDKEANKHPADVLFNLPLAEDQLAYNDPNDKRCVHEIKDGNSTFTLTEDLREQRGFKKINERSGLAKTSYHPPHLK